MLFLSIIVTISGSNLFGHGSNITSVSLGSIRADIQYVSSTNSSIMVRAGPLNNTEDNKVFLTIIANTHAIVESDDPDWTYSIPGKISLVYPSRGQIGSKITINGMNLLGGGTTIAKIYMDGVIPSVQDGYTDSHIVVCLGNETGRDMTIQPGEVYIESDTGAIVSGGSFIQLEPGVIASFLPSQGRLGTMVTINGSNLTGFGSFIESVTVAGFSAIPESLEINEANTSLKLQVGPGLKGAKGPIVITINTGATIESKSDFTYLQNGSISAVDPPTGAEGSGIKIEGVSIIVPPQSIERVTIGGAKVERIVTSSESEVSVIIGAPPAGNSTNLTVQVHSLDGSFVEGGLFSYTSYAISVIGMAEGQHGSQITLQVPFPVDEVLRVFVDEREAQIVNSNATAMTVTVSIPRASFIGERQVDITVESSAHIIARLKDGFLYIQEGVILALSPSDGQEGTRVSIRGEKLLGGSSSIQSVSFNGSYGTVEGYSDGEVNVTVGEIGVGPFPRDVTVTLVSNTGAIVSRLDAFRLVQPGEIASIAPSIGQYGTQVTIQGTNLLQGSLDVTTVSLAGVAVSEIIGQPNRTHIVVTAAQSAAAVGSAVIVLSSGATISSEIEFEYAEPGVITSVTPAVGTRGTDVTISGTNLLGQGQAVEQVLLDGVPATIVSSPSNQNIQVSANTGTDTGVAGLVVVTSNTGATITSNNSWTYEELGAITGVSPSSGQQGVQVVITGTSLLGMSGTSFSQVTLAGVSASIVSGNNTAIVVQAGYIGEATSGSVVAKVDSGPTINSSSILWSYYAAALNFISPATGVNGTTVTLSGTNIAGQPNTLDTIKGISFDSNAGYDISIISADAVSVRAPHSSISGLIDIRIDYTSGAFLVLENAWTFGSPGVIANVNPSSAMPGMLVSISGSNLVPSDATEVTVITGQTESFTATIINASFVQFQAGVYHNLDTPGTALPLHIVSNDGSTVYDASPLFTFEAVSDMVTSVVPSAGGNQSQVVITGINLYPVGETVAAVFLAGVEAKVVSYNSTVIQVIAGPGDSVNGSVVVQSSTGTLTGLGLAWTYLQNITAGNVSPTSGRNGTMVEISAFPSEFSLVSVELSGITADIISIEDNTLTVRASHSNHSTPVGDIVLRFEDDVVLIITNSWAYQVPIVMTNSPADLRGYYNSVVLITGSGLQGGGTVQVASVTLAGFDTAIISQSDTELQVRVATSYDSQGGSVIGPIVITAVDGASYTSSANLSFTYVQLNISSVSPGSGQNGTVVTISGIGLLGGGSSIQSVTLGGVDVQNISLFSDTEIIVVAASFINSTAVLDIVYTTDNEARVTIPASWSYVAPGVVTSVSPAEGRHGTKVIITGQGLLSGGTRVASAYLNDVEVDEIFISNRNDIIHVSAGASDAKSPGIVRIVADTGAEVSLVIGQGSFEYLAPGTITSFIPTEGQYGTIVNITAQGLNQKIEAIHIAGIETTTFSTSGDVITATLSRHSLFYSFSGTIAIEYSDGSLITSSQQFTYLEEGEIYGVNPLQGQQESVVTITGARLRGGGSKVVSATLAGLAADIISDNDDTVILKANMHTLSETANITGDITLTADTGAEVRRVDGWTYIQVGSISSISPEQGQYGTRITITGERLTSGGESVQEVYIGGMAVLEILTSSPNKVVCRAGSPPSLMETVGNFSLVSESGGVLDTSTEWTYLNGSEILDVEPANGTGGIDVNITGTNLLGNGTTIVSVVMSEIDVRMIISANNNIVSIQTGFNPDGQPKFGDIVMESDTGALTVLSNGWAYLSECPFGQFGNNTESCSPCHSECAHCFGPSDYDCYNCINFKIINGSAMQCVPSCPSLSTLDKECVDACHTDQFQEVSTLDPSDVLPRLPQSL